MTGYGVLSRRKEDDDDDGHRASRRIGRGEESHLELVPGPPTDLSMMSYRMVPIHPFTMGINPIDFQIDPQEDYVDLSRSYFKIELRLQKAAGAGNVVAAENTFFVNNIAHFLFKQISFRLNNTLISPQTDTYH